MNLAAQIDAILTESRARLIFQYDDTAMERELLRDVLLEQLSDWSTRGLSCVSDWMSRVEK